MNPRRSLSVPISLAIVMIVMLVALTVGWVVLAMRGVVFDSALGGLYSVLLSVGTIFLVLVLVGVVFYLTLSIKAINLTRRQSNFMDSVTHELKSPIASLKLYLQTLRRRPVSEQERGAFFQSMLEDVERLDALINHLLDAARLDKVAAEDEIEDVQLESLLQQCSESVCVRYRRPVETITLDLQPCIVRARRVDLELIVRNLIDNAVKYAGTPPRVEISLRCQPDSSAVLHIVDNGRGIPPQASAEDIRSFRALGTELERDKPGTGLGLYIVRTLVARLRGRIKVADRGTETGTVFEVQLPGTPGQQKQPASLSAPQDSKKAGAA